MVFGRFIVKAGKYFLALAVVIGTLVAMVLLLDRPRRAASGGQFPVALLFLMVIFMPILLIAEVIRRWRDRK
jgi:hypothetical protein